MWVMPSPKYTIKILVILELQDCKPVDTPIVDLPMIEDEEFPCDPEEASKFRQCIGIGRFIRNFLPMINFAIKVLSTRLQKPTLADMIRLKRP